MTNTGADPDPARQLYFDLLKQILTDSFGIDHSTIQVEQGHCPDDVPT